jgi:hypothetical protein
MLSPNASLAPRVGCWSAWGPSAIGRRVRSSGTRIRTDLPKSPSIRGAPTASSVSRSALRLRSSLEWRRGPSQFRSAMREPTKRVWARIGRPDKPQPTRNKRLADQILSSLREQMSGAMNRDHCASGDDRNAPIRCLPAEDVHGVMGPSMIEVRCIHTTLLSTRWLSAIERARAGTT